jgi:tryptophan 7-halogenase
MPIKPLKKILIVGGGSSGWIAAAVLASRAKNHNYQIELVESEEIGVIGVGESTIPPFVRLIQQLGVDEQTFIRETQACFKLGIKFVDWAERGHSYFHPYGSIGTPMAGQDFYQCWLKAKSLGCQLPLQDFSPCAVMAEQQRFIPPTQLQNTPISGADYAIHLDARKLVDYLCSYAKARGVSHTRGLVDQVQLGDRGFIQSVQLEDGRRLEADFFIDCSGFKARLIEAALAVGLDDWSAHLPCDSALVVKTQAAAVTPAYTTATARKAGWSWRIPLRGAVGHGYVFASRFCDAAEAKSTLLRSLDQARISESQLIHFKTGKRQAFWRHNCLALGLAAGFVEPLESTSLNMVTRGIELFMQYLPDRDCAPELQREYNRQIAADYEEVRDFVLMHYCISKRRDTPFWRWCAEIELPPSLQERIALFKSHGLLSEIRASVFSPSSWQSVLEGMGVHPQKHSPRVDNLTYDDLYARLSAMRCSLLGMVKALPSHDDYLRQAFQQE